MHGGGELGCVGWSHLTKGGGEGKSVVYVDAMSGILGGGRESHIVFFIERRVRGNRE